MDSKELFKRIEEIEYLLRYYNFDCANPDQLGDVLIKAIGQMGEAHSLISKLMDEIEPIKWKI